MIAADRHTIIQVLGGLMNRPDFLNDVDKYCLEPSDFSTQLDRYIFSAIYNLYIGGAETIHVADIDNYLNEKTFAKDLFEKNNGLQFLQDCEVYGEAKNFNYYYHKLKKINLVRDLQKEGYPTQKIYCEDPLDEQFNEINEKFETLSCEQIINFFKGKIAQFENDYTINSVVEESNVFKGVKGLVEELKERPEVGVPLQGRIFNFICRGARKGKFYLRSASSGMGKTRSMVGDACQIAYPIRYDTTTDRWISTGTPQKVLYIMTEQDIDEIQTMVLAYLTGYNEDIFTYGTYGEEHMDRISKAIDIMEKYQDYFLTARIPDPCSSVVKNLFRRYNLQHGVDFFFYDYIFSSPAMLNEYRDLKIREDVALRLMTTTLKNLAVELTSFVMSSTQTSGDDDPNMGFRDYRNIRGSRAIVDLCDMACIRRRPSIKELQLIEGADTLPYKPTAITDIFKNRRGRWNMVSIWQAVDLGTLTTIDLFVTTPDYKIIKDFRVIDFVEEKTEEAVALENFYNNGEVKDEMADELLANIENSSAAPRKMIDDVVQAFEDKQQNLERLRNMSFDELL